MNQHSNSRRGFLKVAATAGAIAPLGAAVAADAVPRPQQRSNGPSPWLRQSEREALPPDDKTEQSVRASEYVAYPGSDYVIDVLKALGIEHVALMPGASFRGLQESLQNYAQGRPSMIECVHEEISAAICHGYAKAAGKPMACVVHSNVGLQHASMAIYNAWCDRVPMMVLVGDEVANAYARKGFVEWYHGAQDNIAMVRDFLKFDDAPHTLEHLGDALVRAYTIGKTPPQLPVAVVLDRGLQEHPIHEPEKLRVPHVPGVAATAPDDASVGRAAEMLLAAKRPLLIADRCARTPLGLARLLELAELLNAPVVNQMSRMNFPSRHYLNHSSNRRAVPDADLIVGLELSDLFSTLYLAPDTQADPVPRRRTAAKVIDINSNHLYGKYNMQDQHRYLPADLTIAADAEAALPALIHAIKTRINDTHRRDIATRGERARETSRLLLEGDKREAARGWDTTPVSTARLCMEIWEALDGAPWSMVSSTFNVSFWPQRLWDMKEWEHDMGGPGGYGVGYQLPAAIGAALAFKGSGRIPVNIQPDGDFMMLPGALWTLAHHEIPLLTVMHNNRAWHQETMHLVRMANRRGRNTENFHQGTRILGPAIDYASMARSMGVWAEGPISDPKELAPALRRALAVVKSGKPALLDVLTQPR